MRHKKKSFRKRAKAGMMNDDLNEALVAPLSAYRTISEDKALKELHSRARRSRVRRIGRKFTKKLKSRARRRRAAVALQAAARRRSAVRDTTRRRETRRRRDARVASLMQRAQEAREAPSTSRSGTYIDADGFLVTESGLTPAAAAAASSSYTAPVPPVSTLDYDEGFDITEGDAADSASHTIEVSAEQGRGLTNAIQSELDSQIIIDPTRALKLKLSQQSSQLMVFLKATNNVLHGFGGNTNNMHISYIWKNGRVAPGNSHVTINLPSNCKPPNCEVIHFFIKNGNRLAIQLARCVPPLYPTKKLGTKTIAEWSNILSTGTNRLCNLNVRQWREILDHVLSTLTVANSQNIITLVTNIFNNSVGGKKRKTRKLRKNRKSRKSRKTRNKKK